MVLALIGSFAVSLIVFFAELILSLVLEFLSDLSSLSDVTVFNLSSPDFAFSFTFSLAVSVIFSLAVSVIFSLAKLPADFAVSPTFLDTELTAFLTFEPAFLATDLTASWFKPRDV
jgi:hypothetical protein